LNAGHSEHETTGAVGYRLHGQGVGVRVPIRARFFSSPCHPDQYWVSLPPGIVRILHLFASYLIVGAYMELTRMLGWLMTCSVLKYIFGA
jgi:hypothetical protein